MSRIKTAIIIALVISVFSCEKEEGPPPNQLFDTVRPGEYFPVYPGSWWAYDTGDTLKTAPDYREFTYLLSCSDINDTETLMLPQFFSNNIFGGNYINRYQISNPILRCVYPLPFIQILSDTLGKIFIKGEPDLYSQRLGKTIVKDTTITVNEVEYEDVIVTIEFDRGCSENTEYSPELCATVREYYAKGVGLIMREEGRNLVYEEWWPVLKLVDYQINNN